MKARYRILTFAITYGQYDQAAIPTLYFLDLFREKSVCKMPKSGYNSAVQGQKVHVHVIYK